MGNVDVRPATATDAAAIRRIGRETWPSTCAFAGEAYIAHGLATWWSDEAVLRGIETTRTFVAELSGDVIGMGNVDLRPERPIIWKLYVVPGHQGTGAGHALMARLLAEVPPGSEVLLEYAAGNTRAADFYRRHGFVELRREAPPQKGWPDQVWMVHRTAAVGDQGRGDRGRGKRA
ncbi:MAG: GNAT family N-acetyltransferase [Nocardioides sp.]|uniref:GNAT family N-acetyltransferase n=1 Tax=Nocardioides sp. TaxID=35761 RepID=UPI0039E693F3